MRWVARARLLLRRPWLVEAASDARERRRWRVVGWPASHELLANVANALAHGHVLPATKSSVAPPAPRPDIVLGAKDVLTGTGDAWSWTPPPWFSWARTSDLIFGVPMLRLRRIQVKLLGYTRWTGPDGRTTGKSLVDGLGGTAWTIGACLGVGRTGVGWTAPGLRMRLAATTGRPRGFASRPHRGALSQRSRPVHPSTGGG